MKPELHMHVTDEARVTTRNLTALVFLKVSQYPFLFLFFVFVPRLMGPEIYGEYALFISLVVIGSSVTNFGGASEIFSRFVPECESRGLPDDVRKIFGNLFFLQNLISLLAGFALFLVLHFFYGDRFPVTYVVLILIMILIRNNYSMYYAFLFGLNEIAKNNAMLPLRRILSLALILVLFHYFGLAGAIVSTLVVDICLTILSVYWTRKYFSLKYASLDTKFMKPYLLYGLVFYLSGGLFIIWQRLGNVFIERMTHSTREVAIFDIPNQVFLLVVGFILPFLYALAPIFTKLLLDEKEYKLSKWSSIAGKYMGIFCTATFFGFAICGEELFQMLLGRDFGGSYLNGVIQLAGIFPVVIASLGVLFSIVYKKPHRFLAALVATIASFAIAASILIPRYGAAGCAIAMVVSCFVLGAIMYLSFRKMLHHSLLDFGKTIGFGMIFFPFLWIRQGFTVSLASFMASLVLYILILLAGKVLRVEEFRSFLQAVRKKSELVELNPSV